MSGVSPPHVQPSEASCFRDADAPIKMPEGDSSLARQIARWVYSALNRQLQDVVSKALGYSSSTASGMREMGDIPPL